MDDNRNDLKEKMLHLQKKTTVEIVKQLGQEIGYGQLMSLASAHWRAQLKEMDVPESGVLIPTLIDYLQGEEREMMEREIKHFDDYIKKYS